MIKRLANYLRTRPTLGRLALRCIPDIRRTIDIEPIGRVQIRLRRHRTYWLRPALNNEVMVLGALQRLVRPGDVVYDVGANIGIYSRFLVQVFSAGSVVAFEPMTENRALLLRNIELGGAAVKDRVRVLPIALSDHEGEESLQIDRIMSGTAALSAVTGGLPSEGHRQYHLPAAEESVTVARLDTVIERERLPLPNVIKIDVEGAETLVLRGAMKTLATHRPRLCIELHGLDKASEVLELLSGAGYACYGFRGQPLAENYGRIGAADIGGAQRRYDIHHLFASMDAEDVREPMTHYGP